MKATGIIRRIDGLGRVAIPKEIRRTMDVHDGDPLEIFTEGRDTVCFRKYEINLSSEVNRLMVTFETYIDDYEKITRIKKLLGEVRNLVESKDDKE